MRACQVIQCVLCFQPFLSAPVKVWRELWNLDKSAGWFWVWRMQAACEDCKEKRIA